ncbi:MAG: hypothetical protein DRJ08_05075 [Acidobacteria bacterium]|nr:MAG: hypothetical protein DRJ08_05075 [Acidobacteriota bacterium]
MPHSGFAGRRNIVNEKKLVVKAGIGAALLGVLCCVGPLVPILLGIGGTGALFGLHRYQPLFIAIGLVILSAAAWIAVRNHNRCCTVRNRKQDIRIVGTVFAVGIGFYLLLQFAVVPVLSSVASNTIQPQKASAAAPDTLSTLKLDIAGMNCAGCAVGIEQALLTVPGVREAHVD